jgi:malonyl-CoA O-methyltransferase
MSAPREIPPGPLLDRAAIRRHHDRASAGYDASAVLAVRLREAMIARLDWTAFSPEVVLDLGCGTGHGAASLAARWPGARVLGLDASRGMLHEAQRRGAKLRIEWLHAEAESLPLPDASVDCVFSNLALPWCEDVDAVFAEVARVLRPRGLFTFTTVGPDTLIELRGAFRAADEGVHVHPFTDMHDIGDGLVRAGFAEPVLDVSRYTLTYPDIDALMRELKATGAQNAASGRLRGLTGRRRLRAMTEAYELYRADGVLPASVEAVFGQAWGALARAQDDGEFAFPVSAIGRREPRGR